MNFSRRSPKVLSFDPSSLSTQSLFLTTQNLLHSVHSYFHTNETSNSALILDASKARWSSGLETATVSSNSRRKVAQSRGRDSIPKLWRVH